mgnify:CR=1 FL=1
MKPRKIDAIISLGYEVSQEGESFDYLGKTPPSDTEINTKLDSMISEWEAQEYARNRKAEYPDMGTQFNKIYDDGIDAWKTDMVDPIKAKYPKP